jgi:hypothetical protein
MVAVVNETGTILLRATPVTEDGPGYQQLRQLLGSAQDCLVALEATGHYWRNLYAALVTAGFEVALLNPLRTRRFAEEELQRTKTDAIDAVGIARFAAQKRPAVTQLPEPVVRVASGSALSISSGGKSSLGQDPPTSVQRDLQFRPRDRYVGHRALDSSSGRDRLLEYRVRVRVQMGTDRRSAPEGRRSPGLRLSCGHHCARTARVAPAATDVNVDCASGTAGGRAAEHSFNCGSAVRPYQR